MLNEKGFTLPEVMLAMGIGSMLIMGAMQFLPMLRQRTQQLSQHYQLDQLLRQTARTLQKDFRRSGFCAGTCSGKSIVIGQASGEAKNSCIVVAYDLNRNGRWEPVGHAESEYFGFRLRSGMLESQRGVNGCNAIGWERMLDPSEVSFSQFQVATTLGEGGDPLIILNMAANWKKNPAISTRLDTWVKVQ
ncbi:prepilin peptidase-dependent protein [Rouxiella badensis]|jgi:prepilin peptidase dependent protein B|uniref:prepilin peptidase-dependent protein n=1 Tax=Rouxiella badensis TaxID=1646377 RepID=UPI0003653E0F|nr:prepilin peptidase-dependent protein [Rouxiella badensis]MCC3719785.1 prepilin peptidase-dependent protein [Rouxiella badensis]MCC3729363.1 prepilin peptidase-dependent protein [Rouxiella badensis]MCC3734780.1 prepilin peptidase-dependent protein [Rouxiella badensis]MCC3741531.1 prepilin peptidase-dependent protein [Rouxiella badensis]MCC3749273.1 prepilin peptidase-dependent protein [Rouxiella badensis]